MAMMEMFDGRCVINSFKHQLLLDSGIYLKHYLFGPFFRVIPYESVNAPNGRAKALLQGPSHISHFSSSSILLHHSPLLRKMPPPELTHEDLNLRYTALISIDKKVTQSFLPKVIIDGRDRINSFKHQSLLDSRIHLKYYPFGPFIRGVLYKSVDAPNR